MPGSKQAWPNRAACWSPAMPLTGDAAPARPTPAAVTPKRPLDGRTSGSTRVGHAEQVAQLGGPRQRADVEEHRAAGVRRLGGVHPAVGPPVRFQSSHESIVPKARSGVGLDAALGEQPLEPWWPRSTGRARGRWCARTSGRGGRRRAARRSGRRCAGPATRWPGAAAAPVRRSHATTVSRWSVMPMAATGSVERRAELGERGLRPRPRSRSASCSTHPGWGKCWGNSRYDEPTTVPSSVERRWRARRWCRRRWRSRRPSAREATPRRLGRVRPTGPTARRQRTCEWRCSPAAATAPASTR